MTDDATMMLDHVWEALCRLEQASAQSDRAAIATSATTLVDRFAVLDEHLSSGGELPDQWEHAIPDPQGEGRRAARTLRGLTRAVFTGGEPQP